MHAASEDSVLKLMTMGNHGVLTVTLIITANCQYKKPSKLIARFICDHSGTVAYKMCTDNILSF